MGYYTSFEINVFDKSMQPIDDQLEEITDKLSDISNYTFSLGSYAIYLHAKWYEWQDDMLALSSIYPNCIFQVIGQGEEIGDYWVGYCSNNVLYKERAILPKVDLSRLGL